MGMARCRPDDIEAKQGFVNERDGGRGVCHRGHAANGEAGFAFDEIGIRPAQLGAIGAHQRLHFSFVHAQIT